MSFFTEPSFKVSKKYDYINLNLVFMAYTSPKRRTMTYKIKFVYFLVYYIKRSDAVNQKRYTSISVKNCIFSA